MAFVSGYEHDVFVSYAHVDNVPLIAQQPDSRWVSTLAYHLQALLSQKLGRGESLAVWKDHGLRGNEPITPDIENAVTRAATLLLILSEGYLASDWCRRERELFVAAAGGAAQAAGRIFVVARDEIERERWPAEINDLLGYSFYETDRDSRRTRTLAVPVPDPHERSYFDRLGDLRSDVADKLRRLGRPASPARPIAHPPGAAAQTESAAGPREPAHRVYLAEVSADLQELREEVARYLADSAVPVSPERFYSRAPERFVEAMDRDLAACAVFVQILGRFPFVRSDDLPGGYEGLQQERAKAAGLPLIRWHSPDLDLATVRDQPHRALLAGPDVVECDVEQFKNLILRTVRRRQVQATAPVPSGDRFVLVNASAADMPMADALGEMLARFDLGFDIVNGESRLAELAEAEDYDALLVVYGGCEQSWVQTRVRDCRQVMLRRKDQAPVCGVFIGPPHEKEPLRCRPPRLHVIEQRDERALKSFVDAVQRRGNSA